MKINEKCFKEFLKKAAAVATTAALLISGMMSGMGALTASADTDLASIGSTGYTTLQLALDAANTGDTITLNGDTAESVTYDSSGKTVTIDGNNHTVTALTSAVGSEPVMDFATFTEIPGVYGSSTALTISGSGVVLLKNVTLKGGSYTGQNGCSAGLDTDSTFSGRVISLGTVSAIGGDSSSVDSIGIYQNGTGTVDVETATGGNTAASASYGVANQGSGTVNVVTATSGTSTSLSYGVANQGSGTVNVATATGGTAQSGSYGVCDQYGGTINVVNAISSTSSHSYGVYICNGGTVNVTTASCAGTGANCKDIKGLNGTVNAGTLANGLSEANNGVLNTDTHALTLHTNIGESCVLSSITVSATGATNVGTLPAVSKNGVIGSWYTDSSYTTPFSGTPVLINVTDLYNQFPPVLSGVTSSVSSGGSISAASTDSGTIYLVKKTTSNYTTATDLVSNVVTSAAVTTSSLTATLTAPTVTAETIYQVYAVDAAGNVSAPVDVTVNPAAVNIGNWADFTTTSVLSANSETNKGTESNPYLISSADDLAFMANKVNAGDTAYTSAYYKLTANIDLSDHYWTPIGKVVGTDMSTYAFIGTFDGDSHTITGLTISDADDVYVGLFGYVGTGGTIKNLGIIGASVVQSKNDGSSSVGALAGWVRSAKISNCYTAGGTVSGIFNTGGLVGLLSSDGGVVINSYSSCTVTGPIRASIGGLMGQLGSGTTTPPYISNCYATGTVTGGAAALVGGLVGEAGCDYSKVLNCYATGAVGVTSGSSAYVGELVGYNEETISNGYWNNDITPRGIGDDTNGSTTCTGMTSTSMKLQDFVDTLNSNLTTLGIHDGYTWEYNVGGYPLLTTTTTVIAVVKTALTTAITTDTTEANTATAGNAIGNYAQSDIDTFNAAIALAQAVVDNASAIQSDVDTAVLNLATAKTTFESKIVIASSNQNSGGNGGSTTTTPVDKTISGTTDSGSSGTGNSTPPTSAKITSNDTNTATVANDIIKLTDVTVTAPASVLNNALGSDSTSWLNLSQDTTSAATQSAINTLAASAYVQPVCILDVNLTRYYSNGTTEAVHQLTGDVTVAIKLTAAQIATIKSVSSAQLLYYDPTTQMLTNINAVFDLTAGTATFSTNHFSTFVIAVKLAAALNLSWDTTIPGKVTWSGVTDASSYTVKLYKDGSLVDTESVKAGTTLYDFTNVIKANGSGAYTFSVTAIGDNVNFTSGDTQTSTSGYTYSGSTSADAFGVTYSTYLQNAWQSFVSNGKESGTDHKSVQAEAVKIKLTGNVPKGASIIYQAHVRHLGWLPSVSDGATAGTTGQSRRLEAIKITLVGMPGYEVKYRAYVKSLGWLAWQTTENGTDIAAAAVAGTTGQYRRAEAIEIEIVKQ